MHKDKDDTILAHFEPSTTNKPLAPNKINPETKEKLIKLVEKNIEILEKAKNNGMLCN